MELYQLTERHPGGPIIDVIEQDAFEIQAAVDEYGNPTRGGRIGHAIAYAIMVCFVGYMFYVL